VGKPPRDPGKVEPAKGVKNEDAPDFEDTKFGDQPPQSAPIRSDPVFQETDEQLEARGRRLMNSLSRFDLNKVSAECWDRFCKGTGGTFTHPLLIAKVKTHDETRAHTKSFVEKLWRDFLARKGDLKNFTPLELDSYAFTSTWDKATGLGILIHDWWSIRADMKDYKCDWDDVAGTARFSATITFTMTDTFGLDWDDIVKHGDDHIPNFDTGKEFKAWYILQHYRKAKPFFLQVAIGYTFSATEKKFDLVE
jgi:hypothetical protein